MYIGGSQTMRYSTVANFSVMKSKNFLCRIIDRDDVTVTRSKISADDSDACIRPFVTQRRVNYNNENYRIIVFLLFHSNLMNLMPKMRKSVMMTPGIDLSRNKHGQSVDLRYFIAKWKLNRIFFAQFPR